MQKAENVEFPCSACGGAAHPASGCFISEKTRFCGPCTRAMWKEVLGHVRGRRTFYAAAFPPPAIDTSFEDTRGDERLCHCESCMSAKRVVPVANGGKFEVRFGKVLKGSPDTWLVIGPYPGCEHCGATWSFETQTRAEIWAGNMSAGEFPPGKDDFTWEWDGGPFVRRIDDRW